MAESLDFRTLLVAFTIIRLLQSAGLLYVWHIHRRYPPAREWAIGAVLVAVGTLLIAAREILPLYLSILGGNFGVLAGGLIFNLGIVRASDGWLPWRLGWAVLTVAMFTLAWHTLMQPSLLVRIGVFGAVMVLFDGFAACAAWNAPRGSLRATQRVIAIFLVLEVVVTAIRSLNSIQSEINSVLQSSTTQSLFILVGIVVAFAITLALAVLTSLIDATKYKVAEIREVAHSNAMALIASGAPLPSILKVVVRGVEAEHRDMLCSVLLLDESGTRLLLGAAPSLPDFYNEAINGLVIGPDVGACGTAAYFGKRVVCVDVATDPRWTLFADLASAAALGACWSEPILDVDGRVLGTFAIYHHRTHTPSKADIATLTEAVQIAGFAIERNQAKRALNEQLQLTQQLLSKSEQTSRILDSALDNMSQGLAMFDKDQKLIVCNEKYLKLYNLPPKLGAPGTLLVDILRARIANGFFAGPNPEDYLRSRVAFGTTSLLTNRELLETLNDGRTIRVTRDSIVTGGWVTTHEDVTELRRSEVRIAFMAHHDDLTGLANRSYFREEIEEACAQLVAKGLPFSVLMLDLDQFKKINDSLGHGAGDALLKEVSARLRGVIRSCDFIARLGGDEFAIVQTGLLVADSSMYCIDRRHDDAIALANRILDIFNEPFYLEGHKVSAGTGIGIAIAPNDGTDPEDLLKKADLALYAAKSTGRNAYHVFEPEMMAVADVRNKLEADMRLAFERDEFEVHYQPIIEARTRKSAGVEALVRWQHPEQGLIAPHHFIRLAEDTGLIIPLGGWVLQQACQDAMGWPEHIKVAVNLSAVQFGQGNLLEVIKRALHESGLPPSRLEVEVTESVLLEGEMDNVSVLHQLKNMGVSVALDDFGTGYSSLTYLKQFPFDKIKIDRSFTQDVTEQASSLTIVSAVIGLARGLGMVTTAEGIETEEQFEIVRIAGVTLAQGYLFGKPCPKSELRFDEDALTAGRASTVA